MEGCLKAFTFALSLFVLYPLLALVPAIGFLGYYVLRRSAAAAAGRSGQVRWSLWAGLFWLAYTLYESWMSREYPSASIRIDLIVVWPAQLLFTFVALRGAYQLEREAGGGEPASRAQTLDNKTALRWALVIGGFSVLDALLMFAWGGASEVSSWAPGFVLTLGLALLLARGTPWARWLLVLRCAFGVFFNLVAGVAMATTTRSDLRTAGLWSVASALFYGVVGVGLILSKRLPGYAPMAASIRGK